MQGMLPRAEAALRPAARSAAGRRGSRGRGSALFLGCAADAFFPQTNCHRQGAADERLRGVDSAVAGLLRALHYHAARGARRAAFAARELRRLRRDRRRLDKLDAIITNAAGCGAMLKDYAPPAARHAARGAAAPVQRQGEATSASSCIELGPVKPTHPLPIKATYHDACHLRHAQQIRKQPRPLLEMIPGLELVPLPESELCCGAAGSYNLTQPEMADAARRPQGGEHPRHRGAGRVHRQRRLPDADHPPSEDHRPPHLDGAPDRRPLGELLGRDARGDSITVFGPLQKDCQRQILLPAHAEALSSFSHIALYLRLICFLQHEPASPSGHD